MKNEEVPWRREWLLSPNFSTCGALARNGIDPDRIALEGFNWRGYYEFVYGPDGRRIFVGSGPKVVWRQRFGSGVGLMGWIDIMLSRLP